MNKPHLTNNIDLKAANTWQEYLTNCNLREEFKGWKFYNNVNCYYIIAPDGRVYDGLYGYQAQRAWDNHKEDLNDEKEQV